MINGALVRCEECYPSEGAHTVCLIVVEREAAQWRERLWPMHQEYFGTGDPLTPVQLEVLDRATQETIERLTAAGLLAPTLRVVRPLFPLPGPLSPPTLTAAERAHVGELREQGARKLKAACVLGEAGLTEEGCPPLLAAILLYARALAATHRVTEPEDLATALLPPLAPHFGEELAILRSFISENSSDWQAAAKVLSKFSNPA